jgi:sugar/nucleoside kinase (ribokinase family)
MSADILIVGHVTRDRNRLAAGSATERPGGSAFYATLTLAALGHPVALVTKLAAQDRGDLLSPLTAAGVRLYAPAAHATTRFDNNYAADGQRSQAVARVAPPILARDLAAPLGGRPPRAVQLGPLIDGDLAPAAVHAARTRCAWLALDVQGLVRRKAGGRVRGQAPARPDLLGLADILKADAGEAMRATGLGDPRAAARRLARLGRGEAVVTLGAAGALVVHGERMLDLPALPPPGAGDPTQARDTTGCGDTFLAVYLARRLAGDGPAAAARLATAAAGIKAGQGAPVQADLATLRRHAETLPHPAHAGPRAVRRAAAGGPSPTRGGQAT